MRCVTEIHVGSVRLSHPIMTASGTSGHGAELAPYGELSSLGAVVVKSLAAVPWPGNPAPRLYPTGSGMLNAVGLQGPGVAQWVREDLPALAAARATVVASLWGRSVDEYERGAESLAQALDASEHGGSVVAVEVNLSCPNLHGHGIIAHDEELSERVVAACAAVSRPLWAKLSPNTDRLVTVAGAVRRAGAEAVTLVNTVTGMVLDPRSGLSVLGVGGGGGLSGPPIHPVAVKAVYDVFRAWPDLPIIGVGGVRNAWDAAELMLAGARGVQVGTATFANPRAPFEIARDLERWARDRGVDALGDLTGLAHRGGIHPSPPPRG
ncbi:MAG: dihydroorotate dehydrogenase [Ilumatobacteraceae bacterium]